MLLVASESGRKDVVRLLLEHGADSRSRDKLGFNALMFAAERGQLEIVDLLLANGADIGANAKNNRGDTALVMAAVWPQARDRWRLSVSCVRKWFRTR